MKYTLGLYEKAMPNSLSIPQKLMAVKECGFDAMELSIDETDEKLARLDWDEHERDQIRTACRQSDVMISTICLSAHRRYSLGSHDGQIRELSIDILRKTIILARDLGIRIIQLAGYDVYYETGDAHTRQWFRENLKQCVEIAAAYGVVLGFETMETSFMDNISKAMRYVNEVCMPYLGVYPDLGNLTNACEMYGDDVHAEIMAGRGHLLAMHLKETVPGQYRDMQFGTGHVEFAKGIKAALSVGVRLFVAECWYAGENEWRDTLKKANAFMRTNFEIAQRDLNTL
ncbi:MAG: L-ribulose-5-phosphate 3-epimerase [Clostridiales bacterium]|nr:L-ribulose-5-phosphate 3-epimerase [Clostridiales bacterium]